MITGCKDLKGGSGSGGDFDATTTTNATINFRLPPGPPGSTRSSRAPTQASMIKHHPHNQDTVRRKGVGNGIASRLLLPLSMSDAAPNNTNHFSSILLTLSDPSGWMDPLAGEEEGATVAVHLLLFLAQSDQLLLQHIKARDHAVILFIQVIGLHEEPQGLE